ncbi:hypothetical protein B9Z35_08145 [Limnohabitans sp. Jir61]|nr:hypothetical protein B9Z35_08145 [Limnohabitans sp. Jir61]
MNQSATGSLLQGGMVKRFSPLEIRETIQTLVATEQIDTAYALGEAGLAIYPASEDMLAICGLLAVMRQDWPAAVELLQELVEAQGQNIQPFTYVMLVRALRCNLDPAGALKMANQGLQYYPGQLELEAERLSLDIYSDAVTSSAHTH